MSILCLGLVWALMDFKGNTSPVLPANYVLQVEQA